MIVLFYHLVTDRDLSHLRPLYRCKTPRAFAADLEYLRRGHRFLAHDEVLGYIEAGLPFPPSSVLLTFDDGYRQCFSEVRPLLLEHRVPAIFFVPSELVGNRRLAYRNAAALAVSRLAVLPRRGRSAVLGRLGSLLGRPLGDREEAARALKEMGPGAGELLARSCRELGVDPEEYLRRERPYLEADEVRQLAADGFTIGGHSRRHTPLDSMGEEELEEEIVTSTRAVLELAGQSRAPFAFPFAGFRASPGFINRLLERRRFLTLLFGGPEVGNRRVISRRLWADTPVGTGGRRSNLPRLLREFAGEGEKGRISLRPGPGEGSGSSRAGNGTSPE